MLGSLVDKLTFIPSQWKPLKKKKAGLIVLKYIAELDRQKESAEG